MPSAAKSITVVVPALNEEHHLESAVEIIVEAVERWFDEYEIFIYNDGSTDSTGEVAERIAARNGQITAIHHARPQCLGGVIQAGLQRATMTYFMWIDGKGATTAESLNNIFSRCGEADLVVPWPTNQHERPFVRRVISRTFVVLFNTLFRLRLNYYTHPVLCRTEQAQRFTIRTASYAFQVEALIKMIKSGCSYVQVPVKDHFQLQEVGKRKTKAFRWKNVSGTLVCLLRTLWDVYVRPERLTNRPENGNVEKAASITSSTPMKRNMTTEDTSAEQNPSASNPPRCQRVNTHTEWDPLREVIVGIATGAQVPTVRDHALHCVEYGLHSDEEFAQIKTGLYPPRMIEETNEDLDALSDELTKLGIIVHRPPVTDFTAIHSTPDWSVDGYHAYCPRDAILTVGNQAIETPMTLRHRVNEARIYRDIVETVQIPHPRLLDSMYDRSVRGKPTLCNEEPALDAANCLKIGRDIMVLISNTGNQAAADWLGEHLGPEYRIHCVRDVYCFIHIDSTILPLRPGLVLLCPDRVNEDNLPEFFRSWDKIYAPEPVEMPAEPGWNSASKWIAMNIVSLRPDLAIVEKRQLPLIRLLERYKIDVLPVQLRHMRTMGGGPHCITLDLVRDGELEDYA